MGACNCKIPSKESNHIDVEQEGVNNVVVAVSEIKANTTYKIQNVHNDSKANLGTQPHQGVNLSKRVKK